MKKIGVGFYFILIAITILTLSIGYSSFHSQLGINDVTANVRVKKDIRITNIKLNSVTQKAVSKYNEYNHDMITAGFSLPNKKSTISYDINVTNFGNIEMGILELQGMPNNLIYRIDNYKLKDSICNGNKCTLGTTLSMKITFEYLNTKPAQKEDFKVNLKFVFKKMHKITYNKITDKNLITKTIDGAPFEYTFVEAPPDNVKIQMGSKVLLSGTDYTYLNGKLQINNVTDNLTITGIASPLTITVKENGWGKKHILAYSIKNVSGKKITSWKLTAEFPDGYKLTSQSEVVAKVEKGKLILSNPAWYGGGDIAIDSEKNFQIHVETPTDVLPEFKFTMDVTYE